MEVLWRGLGIAILVGLLSLYLYIQLIDFAIFRVAKFYECQSL